MKAMQWQRDNEGDWFLMDVTGAIVEGWADTLKGIERFTRHQRNFGRRMDTTMRYW